MGWSATTGTVSPWVYQKISETFILDPEMRARLSELNPKSSARVADRLLEACERQLVDARRRNTRWPESRQQRP